MMKKTMTAWLLTLALLVPILQTGATTGTTAQASVASAGPTTLLDAVVDVSVSAGSLEFNVFSVKKRFSVVPVVVKGVLFAQVERILPFLGYTVKYDAVVRI